jgi:hypothetical protein
MTEIKEADWRVFRKLHKIALERFCQRVLEEVRVVAGDCDDGYHECYLKLYKLIRSRDKTIAVAFDDPRRSTAFILLAKIVEEGLLTDAELNQFSLEVRERINVIERFWRT